MLSNADVSLVRENFTNETYSTLSKGQLIPKIQTQRQKKLL